MKATVLYYSHKGKTAFFAREIAMYLWSKGLHVSLCAISDFDPQTGLTLEYRAWGDADTDASKEIIECNYGFGVGEKAALKRIVSE